MTDAKQHRGNRGDVVAGVGDAGLEPVVADRHRREVGFDPVAERDHAPDHEREVDQRSEEHTSELQSLMRISYAVFCLKKKKTTTYQPQPRPVCAPPATT